MNKKEVKKFYDAVVSETQKEINHLEKKIHTLGLAIVFLILISIAVGFTKYHPAFVYGIGVWTVLYVVQKMFDAGKETFDSKIAWRIFLAKEYIITGMVIFWFAWTFLHL